MPMNFERELLARVIETLDTHILTGPRGAPGPQCYTREGRRKVLVQWGGFAGAAAAYLALTQRDDNPHFGSDPMLKLALDAGDRLVIDHAHVGRTSSKPDHFTIYPMATLYRLAAEHAGRARRARWRELLARNLRAVSAVIDRLGENLGRPAPWAGTGPNHILGWLAVGCGCAMALEDGAMIKKVSRAMGRMMRLQAPGGYFPEHVGPSAGYHGVSLRAVAEFHRLRPAASTLKRVERGVHFMVRALYPDLRRIATFDERNRLGGASLHSALPWTAEGRGLLKRFLQQRREPRARRSGPFGGWWALGGLFLLYQHATAAAARTGRSTRTLPLEKKRFTWKLEDRGFVRKEGPWFYALSAYVHPTRHGNPYHFERTEAFSVYHDKAGLIVGGGNDKRAPFAATVHLLEGLEVHYFPPIGGGLASGVRPKVLTGRKPCDRLTLDYGSAAATIELRAESSRRLRIGLRVDTSMFDPEIHLVLQLPLRAPVTLHSGRRKLNLRPADRHKSKETVTVQRKQHLPGYVLGKTLSLPGKWQMDLPRGASLIWPHLPWNGYLPPDYRSRASDAVALLRVPAPGPDSRCEVVVRV